MSSQYPANQDSGSLNASVVEQPPDGILPKVQHCER